MENLVERLCAQSVPARYLSDFIANTAFIGGALHVNNVNVIINRGIMERNHVVVGLIYAKQEASVSINGTGIRKCNTYSMLNAGSPVVYFLQSTGYIYLSYLNSVYQ